MTSDLFNEFLPQTANNVRDKVYHFRSDTSRSEYQRRMNSRQCTRERIEGGKTKRKERERKKRKDLSTVVVLNTEDNRQPLSLSRQRKKRVEVVRGLNNAMAGLQLIAIARGFAKKRIWGDFEGERMTFLAKRSKFLVSSSVPRIGRVSVT